MSNETKLNLKHFSGPTERRAKLKIATACKDGALDPRAFDETVGITKPGVAIQSFLTNPDSPDFNGTTTTPRQPMNDGKAPVDDTSSKKDHLDRAQFKKYREAVSDTRTLIDGPKGGDFGGSDRMPNADTTNYSFDFDWDDEKQSYRMKTANKTQHAAVDGDPLTDEDSCSDHLARAAEAMTDAAEATDEDERDTREHFMGKSMEHFQKAVRAHRRERKAHK